MSPKFLTKFIAQHEKDNDSANAQTFADRFPRERWSEARQFFDDYIASANGERKPKEVDV